MLGSVQILIEALNCRLLSKVRLASFEHLKSVDRSSIKLLASDIFLQFSL